MPINAMYVQARHGCKKDEESSQVRFETLQSSLEAKYRELVALAAASK